MNEVLFALGLTAFAGMATGIGSMIAFTAKRTDYRFLSVATGFSAGVMLYVSFVEIFAKGVNALTVEYGEYWGHWINAASFFAGMLLIGLIDNLIPAGENPHETHSEAEIRPLHNPAAPVPDFFGSSSFGVDLMYTGIKSTPNDGRLHEQSGYHHVRARAAGTMGNRRPGTGHGNDTP